MWGFSLSILKTILLNKWRLNELLWKTAFNSNNNLKWKLNRKRWHIGLKLFCFCDFPKVKLFGITVIQPENIELFLSLTFFSYKSLLEVSRAGQGDDLDDLVNFKVAECHSHLKSAMIISPPSSWAFSVFSSFHLLIALSTLTCTCYSVFLKRLRDSKKCAIRNTPIWWMPPSSQTTTSNFCNIITDTHFMLQFIHEKHVLKLPPL